MRIEVDPQVLVDSGRRLDSIGSQLGMLSDALGAALGSGIASGMDPAGMNFGIKYGRQAQQFADALAKAVEAHEVVGFMLAATGDNYENADAASTIGGPGPTDGAGGQPGKTTAADVPMGPSGAVVPPPTMWAILQPFLGPMMSWPSGNPSLLRVTGAQWRNLATGLSAFDGDMAAIKGLVAQQEIPEGGKIGQALADLDEGVTTLADMAKTIGQSVDDFAGGVQDTQDAIRRLMDRISLDGLWDTVTGFLTGEGDDILREIAHDVGEVLENFQNQVKGVVGLLEELTIALGLAADAFQRWIRPILVETFGDDVGNALADSVTLYTDFQVGLTTGLINTVSGVVSMADVDTWKGMAELAQSVAQDPSTLPGVLANMGKEFVAWDKWSGDHPGRAAGEAAFNIGSLFVPGGALSKTGSVAKGLSYTTRLFDEGRLPRLSDVPGLGGGDRLPDLDDVPGAGRGLPEMPEFRPGTVPDSVIGPFAPNGAGTPTSPSAPGGPARAGDPTGTPPPGGRGQGTGGSDGPPVGGDGPAPVDSGTPAASSAPSPDDAAPAAAPGGSPTPDSASGNGSGATTSDPEAPSVSQDLTETGSPGDGKTDNALGVDGSSTDATGDDRQPTQSRDEDVSSRTAENSDAFLGDEPHRASAEDQHADVGGQPHDASAHDAIEHRDPEGDRHTVNGHPPAEPGHSLPQTTDAAHRLNEAFANGHPTVALAAEVSEWATHRVEGADRVVLGRWDGQDGGYIGEARHNGGGTYFDTGDEAWDAITRDLSDDDAKELGWQVNEQFLRAQLENGVARIDYMLDHDLYDSLEDMAIARAGSFSAMEIEFLSENASKYGYERVDDSWIRLADKP